MRAFAKASPADPTSEYGNGRSYFRLVAMVLALGFALLAYTAPSSKAATPIDSYGYHSTFGLSESGVYNSDGYANALAVDGANGNILTVDDFTFGLYAYGPDPDLGGALLSKLDTGTVGVQPSGIAVDPADGSTYLYDVFTRTVKRFISDGAPTPTYSLDNSYSVSPSELFVALTAGLAVDDATGNLLVSDPGSQRVYRLDDNGILISSFDGADTAQGAFVNPRGIAVGPSGAIYVVDGERVERFASDGTSQGQLSLIQGAVPLRVAANPESGEVVVLAVRSGRTFLEGFTATGQRLFSVMVPPFAEATFQGLGWDGLTDRIYISASDGTIRTFIPFTQPGVDQPIASNFSSAGAHVEAAIAAGSEPTTARLEYCPANAACGNYLISDPNDTSNPWVRGPEHEGLTGNVTIEDDLPLLPNQEYRVRAYASNARVDNSATATIVTPLAAPEVETKQATFVTDTQAQLNGVITTFGAQTTYHFEYGPTESYGSQMPVAGEATAGNGRSPRDFQRTITGLQPGSTYHYRLVAQNGAGTTVGDDQSFTTDSLGSGTRQRAYEQVTPVDKQGAVLSPLHAQVLGDGSGFVVATNSATPQGNSALIFNDYVARRGTDGWLDWEATDPPLASSAFIMEAATTGVSADMRHALVISNRALAPGGLPAPASNLYIHNLEDGTFTFVGASTQPGAFTTMTGPQFNQRVFLAGAPDFSWIVFNSTQPLLPGAPERGMYKWTESDGLTLESRLPGNAIPTRRVYTPHPNVLRSTLVSADGNVMYFSFDLGTGEQGVYRRANGDTTAISISHRAGDPPTVFPGRIEGSSPDGRFAIFRSPAPLTEDVPDSFDGGWGLYQYDAQDDSLKYLTTASVSEGRLYGVSDDAQTVYYWDPHDVGPSSSKVWRNGTVHTIAPYDLVGFAVPSHDGRYLAYLETDKSAHLYDADTDQSVCVSCVSGDSVGAAARIGSSDARGIGNRAVQVVTDDGTMFFNTDAQLVSADRNAASDVYEYHTGRLHLISPGNQDSDAVFIDASDDGKNVFFTTDQGLVGQDVDGQIDLYDARVGGGFPGQSPPPPPASCERADCAGAGSGPGVNGPPIGTKGAGAANRQPLTLSLAKVNFGPKAVRISFSTSGPGRIKVTGSDIQAIRRKVSKAGRYSVTAPLTKQARSKLRAGERLKVSVKVTLFGGGETASVKATRTLGN